MLEAPKYGWSRIRIGEWSERVSYIDDVPFMLFDALGYVQLKGRPYAVKFDAEGFEHTIVFDVYETHIIAENPESNGFQYHTIASDIDKLTLELVNDIRRDIDGWSAWTDYGGMSWDEKSERRADLLTMCDIAEKRVRG